MQFTRQELDLLFEAVEKWEDDDLSGEMFGQMMEAAMGGAIGPAMKEKIATERSERERKRKEAQKRRKERGVLLRAKLIQIRDGMDAESLLESSRQ